MSKLKMSFLSAALLCCNIAYTKEVEKTLYQKTCNFLQNNKNAIIASVASAATTVAGFYYFIMPTYMKKINFLEEKLKSNTLIVAGPDGVLNRANNASLEEYVQKWEKLFIKDPVSLTEIISLLSEGFIHPEWRTFWTEMSKRKSFEEIADKIFDFIENNGSLLAIVLKELPQLPISTAEKHLNNRSEYVGIYTNIHDVYYAKNGEKFFELSDKNRNKYMLKDGSDAAQDIEDFMINHFAPRLLNILKKIKNKEILS